MELPFVSVLIPLYNGIEFLGECIKSIREQTYKNWEIIIGVNGHPKDSMEYKMTKIYNNEQIRSIEYLSVKGKTPVLNLMVKDAKYKLICLIDVDDLWEKTKLEKQVNIYLKYNYDVIGTQCLYFGNKNISPYIPTGEIDQLYPMFSNPMVNSSIMIKRELAHWNEEAYFGLEDYDLWLLLSLNGKKFYNIDEKLVFHRCYKESFFNKKNTDNVANLHRLWSHLYCAKWGKEVVLNYCTKMENEHPDIVL